MPKHLHVSEDESGFVFEVQCGVQSQHDLLVVVLTEHGNEEGSVIVQSTTSTRIVDQDDTRRITG